MPRQRRENPVRVPTRTYAMTLAISTALAVAGVAGCAGDGDKKAAGGERELFLQPVAAQGPDPFTDSTAKSTATPSVTRSPQPSPTGSATPQGTRSLSGGTPGLYGGTHAVGSCDVGQQIRFLTADRAKARAFAEASGIEAGAIPGFLRGLTPVVLRADTRVTNHGFRDGSATGFQSVLQSGTAVLVDDRGLPRVRCACGNPLKPPVAFQGAPRHNGQPWSGYQPTQVVVVTPAPRPITNITIVNIVNNTWIERKIGDEDADEDRRAKPPVSPTPTPSDQDRDRDKGTPDESVEPSDPDGTGPTDPDSSSTDCPTPSPVTGTPTEPPSPLPPGCPSPTTTPPTDMPPPPEGTTDTPQQEPQDQPYDESPEDIGPETVPDAPDQSDDGLVPDDPYLSENPLDDSDPGTFAS